ncbi:MAG: cytochrome c biogenesis protein CcdA [Bacteroidia bacterium]
MKTINVAFLLPVLFLAYFSFPVSAQIIENPVHWKFEVKRTGDKTYELFAKANVDPGWYIYSQQMDFEGPGPVKTEFTYIEASGYNTKGKTLECGNLLEEEEPVFDNIIVRKYKKEVIFYQAIELTGKSGTVNGNVYFMTCNDETCLPPEEEEFSFKLTGNEKIEKPFKCEDKSESFVPPAGSGNSKTSFPQAREDAAQDERNATASEEKPAATDKEATGFQQIKSGDRGDEDDPSAGKPEADSEPEEEASAGSEEDPYASESPKSMWQIFFESFLGGFAVLLTPCVFPMIPLTVSFFTKQNQKRSKGIGNAIVYGLSIIGIFVLLGFLITKIFGNTAVYEMSTSMFFNLLFFVVFVIFAMSFFGAFELSLPTSWVNKVDSQSDKGGLLGIFFMALTLVLVSFSCIGPIIGLLLVQAATTGGASGPLIGMFGFSLAMALPFVLFAIFPSWLNSLPKSGGWLNSVKVVLGFVELALAFKFLSNVDLAYHWGFLKREIFLGIWIVLFTMMGFYLLGKLKFSHDSDLPYISVPRLFMSMIAFAFSIYMIPGIFGAPLTLLSGILPPSSYTIWEGGLPGQNSGYANSSEEFPPEIAQNHCPHNLPCFHDYYAGLEYAKKVDKPVFIDFTGWSCVNCRRMEDNVWIDPRVQEILAQDFVMVSLYVDDREKLPEDEHYVSEQGGRKKKIDEVGKKWLDFEITRFGRNAQPYYVLLDHNEQVLSQPRGYDPSVSAYLEFLREGLAEFDRRSSLTTDN